MCPSHDHGQGGGRSPRLRTTSGHKTLHPCPAPALPPLESRSGWAGERSGPAQRTRATCTEPVSSRGLSALPLRRCAVTLTATLTPCWPACSSTSTETAASDAGDPIPVTSTVVSVFPKRLRSRRSGARVAPPGRTGPARPLPSLHLSSSQQRLPPLPVPAGEAASLTRSQAFCYAVTPSDPGGRRWP